MFADSALRSPYRPSRGLRIQTFLPLAVATLAVAVGLAILLSALFRKGWYFIFWVPLVAAIIGAGCVLATVYFGHCQNRWVAAGLGILTGCVIYLGQYHVRLVQQIGTENIHRVDILPSYIAWEVKNLKTEDIGERSRKSDRDDWPASKLDIFMNWFLFASELAIVVGICLAAGLVWASRAYCTRHNRWMKRKVLNFPSGSSAILEPGVRPETLAEFLKQPEVVADGRTRAARVTIEYCPPDPTSWWGSEDACPVLFSLRETPFKVKASRLRLTHEEIPVVAHRVPELTGGQVPAGAAAVVSAPNVAPQTASRTDLEREQTRGAGFAAEPRIRPSIETLSGPHAGQILRMPHTLFANLTTILLLLSVIAGPLLALGGIAILESAEKAGGTTSPMLVLGWALVGVGTFLLVAGCYVVLTRGDLFTAWYYRRLVNRHLAARGDAAVRPDDPEAILVRMVPRANLLKPMLEDATDIGYLRLDPGRREIQFEGDRQRYRIPLAAVSFCSADNYAMNTGQAITIKKWYLTVRCGEDFDAWEAPFVPLGRPSRGKKRVVQEFAERVDQLQR